jgi:hypothetical protein
MNRDLRHSSSEQAAIRVEGTHRVTQRHGCENRGICVDSEKVLHCAGFAESEHRPLSLGRAINVPALIAEVASKLVVGLIGTAAIGNYRFVRQIFTFLSGASVLALASALHLEYARCVVIALCSTVERNGKAACVVAYSVASLAGDGLSGHLSSGSVTAYDAK